MLVVGALLGSPPSTPNTGYFPTLFAAFALMGLGMGTAMLPLMTIAMSGVPGGRGPRQRDHQHLDAARRRARDRHPRHARVGSHRRAHQFRRGALSALTGGYTLAFQVAAGAVIVGIAIASWSLRMPREREPAPGSEVAVEV